MDKNKKSSDGNISDQQNTTQSGLTSQPPTYLNGLRMLCGGISAASAKTVLAPLTRVTIILQNQGMPSLTLSPPPQIQPPSSSTLINQPNIQQNQHIQNTSVQSNVLSHSSTPSNVPSSVSSTFPTSTTTLHSKTAASLAKPIKPLIIQPSVITMASTAQQPLLSTPYTNAISSFKYIMKNEGFLSLWNGNGTNICRVIPNYGLRFALTDVSRRFVAQIYGQDPETTRHQMSKNQLLLAGSITAVIQITATYPLEIISTRLAVSGSALTNQQFHGINQCINSLWKENKFRAFYNGYLITLLAGTPYIALQMSCFELLQRYFHRLSTTKFAEKMPSEKSTHESTTTQPRMSYENIEITSKICAGALASLFAQTVTYPGDVLRRRMQVDGINSTTTTTTSGISTNTNCVRAYNGLLDAVVKIYKQEGWKAFFKGIQVNSLRIIPEGAMMFLFVDKLKRMANIEQYDTH